MKRWPLLLLACGLAFGFVPARAAAEKTAAERGRETLLGRAFSPPFASLQAYDQLWKQWGLPAKPADYERAFRERYGVHAAPYPNGGRAMGFREAPGLFSKGITNDCLLCHAGRVAGQTILGLGNAALDLHGLYEDLAAADGVKLALPFRMSNVRGTIEANAALAYLMQFRDPDLSLRPPLKLPYRDDLCEDIPAWWHLKKKKTMYHIGAVDARSVRSLMPFMLSPFNSGASIKKEEPAFADIRAYILSLEPPKYPFPVDAGLAARGKAVFLDTCARCHGTYGPDGTYPNKIVGLDVIGTDPSLAQTIPPETVAHYLKSWFAQDKGPDGTPYEVSYKGGYQAPPLDGVWATAPYFHNGSVPTVYHVLNSKARPRVFTRTYRSEKEDYDPVRLGLKVTVLEPSPDPKAPAFERRKIYDTTQGGRGNGGHTFGDKLTELERLAVIEYLKTL